MAPDVSQWSRDEINSGRPSTQVKNRRLCYLRRHPEYFVSRSSLLAEASVASLDDGPASLSHSSNRVPPEERIGGPISANLLEAYDLDRRLASQRHREARELANAAAPLHDVSDRSVDSTGQEAHQTRQTEENGEEEEQEAEEEFDSDSAEEDKVSATRRDLVETFLAGRDHEFDYGTVDYDESLDDLVLLSQEEQERFFDGEEEEEVVGSRSEGTLAGQTGIQDY